MAGKKLTGKNGCRGKPGPGRPKGLPNKTTALLKDAILKAAEQVGDNLAERGQRKEGLVGYLKRQAEKQPGPFLALLGKVLPLQISNDGDTEFKVSVIERKIVKASNPDD